jgi:hypothetical protein
MFLPVSLPSGSARRGSYRQILEAFSDLPHDMPRFKNEVLRTALGIVATYGQK